MTGHGLQQTATHFFSILHGGNSEPWVADAACTTGDPEAWWPVESDPATYAKAICWGCPVRAECLQYALEHDEREGVWGGVTERERRSLKRRMQRKSRRRAA